MSEFLSHDLNMSSLPSPTILATTDIPGGRMAERGVRIWKETWGLGLSGSQQFPLRSWETEPTIPPSNVPRSLPEDTGLPYEKVNKKVLSYFSKKRSTVSQPAADSEVYRRDIDESHVNFDCSGSAPINAWLKRYQSPLPHGHLQVIPHAVAQLKSVVVHGTPENLQEIIAHLSHPAPLLESLRIEVDGGCCSPPAIVTTLFNGDLSLLRELCLQGISTELPWRNMTNLTSFTIGCTRNGEFSVIHLLDFFESAPHLCKVHQENVFSLLSAKLFSDFEKLTLSFQKCASVHFRLLFVLLVTLKVIGEFPDVQFHNATPTFDGQIGRLVPLMYLERMVISGSHPPSLLFDHLLIPVNAKLAAQVKGRYYYVPKSFDTIRALTGFAIHMHVAGFHPNIQFSETGAEISIIPATPPVTPSCRVLESLALFDPSKIERLRLAGGDLMVGNGCAIGPAIWGMTHLRALTISRCRGLPNLIPILAGHSKCPCPDLEELVIDPRAGGEKFDIQHVVAMAATRASKGMKLKSIKIVSRDKFVQTCALKLKEHVSHVECSPRVALVSDDIDSGDEEDRGGSS